MHYNFHDQQILLPYRSYGDSYIPMKLTDLKYNLTKFKTKLINRIKLIGEEFRIDFRGEYRSIVHFTQFMIILLLLYNRQICSD